MKTKITVRKTKMKAYLRKLIVEHEMDIPLETDKGETKTIYQLARDVKKWISANDGKVDVKITFEY